MKALSDPSIVATQNSVLKQRVLDRIHNSELFQSYRMIFQTSTGLPLELHASTNQDAAVCRGSVNQNRFCHLLNQGNGGCQQCLVSQRCLSEKGSGVQSIECFAGLQETAVSVVLGGEVIAQLKTGQIFYEEPTNERFSSIADALEHYENGFEEAYLATPVIEKQKYRAMVTLLAAFSLQLSKLANQIALELSQQSFDAMATAKDYIEDMIDSPIHLDDVAAEVNMSPFHFCRKFKESAGMTLTDYVSHRRVDLAKEALEETDQRITDIAFDVGFQSLSQFNRSFHKITGMSPTNYRKSKVA